MIEQIDEKDFSKTVPVLNNSTIGEHSRHIIEFFICLKNSLPRGTVSYDERAHDPEMERNKQLSLSAIAELTDFLGSCSENVPLKLASNYSLESDKPNIVDSNLYRELTYNIEHAIHHMAIIRIGLNAIAPYVKVAEHFGIAVSTIKFKRKKTTF